MLIGVCGTGLVVGGAFAYVRVWGDNSRSKEKVAELTGPEFNDLQDPQLLREALNNNHLPWTFHQRIQKEKDLDPLSPKAVTGKNDMKLVFYRLLGCPYCAKVESVLRYYDVPYDEVQIDPITGSGLPDPRYRLAPQLYFVPLQSKEATEGAPAGEYKDGVYLVDSARIVTELAAPLGYGKDLKDPRITATRDWITTRFHSASFVVTNSTIRNAYVAYEYLTPKQYQNFFYRLVGSVALYGLANFKIKPRVLAQPHPLEEAYRQVRAARPGEDGGKAATSQSPEEWLRDELGVFLMRLNPKDTFHGGATPDLADVEMYGVTRVVSDHPRLSKIVKEGRFGEWEGAMEEVIKTRRNGRA